jgi:CDP-diacylglycerol--serine O-phosphatidyltransferase
MIRQIPNLLTLTNLIFGCISIILTLKGEQVLGAWFIIFALLFDFLDGLAARLLDAQSRIGNLLDSLADIVSFGVAPAIALYVLLDQSAQLLDITSGSMAVVPFLALLFPAAAAYRLARFSSSDNEESSFRGLPTPAAALFMASLPLIKNRFTDLDLLQSMLTNQLVLLVIIVILSLLMVSSIPLLSFKFKNLSWSENQSRYLLILLSVILIILIQCAAFPIIIFSYILLSLVESGFSQSH